jgi:protein Tob/BTG
MLEEIESAVNFLTRLIAKSNDSSLLITQESIDSFSKKLCQLLEEKFRDHWFPEKPIKGQAYRCIRINENNRRDPIVEKACRECGIRYDELKLPLELTLWVDPNEVTCRSVNTPFYLFIIFFITTYNHYILSAICFLVQSIVYFNINV